MPDRGRGVSRGGVSAAWRARRWVPAGLVLACAVSACGEGDLATRDEVGGGGVGLPEGGGGAGASGGRSGPGEPDDPGGAGGPGSPPEGDPEEPRGEDPLPPVVPGEAVFPRLTADEYRNTLVDVFGDGLPRTPVEPDTNPYLFYSIGAATTEVSERGVEQYGEAAFLVAQAVFADPARRDRVLRCAPTAPDDACIDAFVRGLGRRLFRRPLDEEEVAQWVAVARDTAEGDPARGAETVVAGLLQSPNFLYRVEVGEPLPGGDGTKLRYSSWEMASRLAFLLTRAGPDDALLDAAERGELLDDASLRTHADRLLAHPRVRDAVQDFFAQYLDLKRLEQVDLDPAAYPGFNRGLVRAMETEMRLLVDDLVFRRGGDIRELFSARRGYVNDELAILYGVEAPGATRGAFVPVEFPADRPRAGILTLGAFLTMNAHRTETSPTLRGKYIRERVLCEEVPPPPDDVDLDLERGADDPPTLRERLEQHRQNPMCRGCHSFIDPPGFLFEHYDSMGRYRDAVDGYAVNATGDLDGLPLNDALDLAAILRDDVRVAECVTRQLFRYATGRLDTRDDLPARKRLDAAFEASGYDFRTLLSALVLSEAFRTVAPAAPEGMP